MARIPDDTLNRLKREVSLMRLVEKSGVALKPHGKDRIGHCPFHDDKTPSLVVSPDSNLWHCLGACQTGGSVVDWVMKTQGVSFRHAVEILRADVPALAAVEAPIKKTTTKKLDGLLSEDAEAQQLLNQVVDYYHETLLASPEALDYLAGRGLNSPELIERFKLGYANRTLGYRLPEKNRKAGAAVRGTLQEVGILRDSGHEHLTGSVVVPIFDGRGNVCELYGRKILGSKLRKGTAQHLYLPGPHAGVWNAEGLEGQEEVILCEALIDAMTFWVNGYRNVTASYGTSGFTEDHLALFKQLGIQRVLIAYDRDAAGNNAAVALAKKLAKENIDCYRLHFPKGMDANQYALEVTPAAKSLGVVIRSAEYMGEGPAPDRSCASMHSRHTVHPEHKRQLDIETQTGVPGSTPSLAALAAESSEPPTAGPDERQGDGQEGKSVAVPHLPASAVPPAPEPPVEPEVSEHEVNVTYGTRRYRVRGLQKNTSYEVLKVNLLVTVDEVVHVDTFDLYSAKHRQAFARLAAAEAGVEDKIIQRDLGQLLLQLERLQDQAIQETLKPKEPTAYTLNDDDREAALTLLRDPDLATRIVNDFTQTGLVGEPTNALMGYLATVSRKLKTPLAIIVQSTSAAGKSALMDAVLKLVPEEDRVHYSAMTGQSLFYLGETNLKHKILGIAEEEGVRQAAYALKLLQSQGELTIASTGKDPQTGKLVTEEYRVEGPVMLFLTTTAIDIDEELLNRCVVLTINESREQTAAIQQRQRQARTLEGLLAGNEAEQLIQQHQNAQRLLRLLAVVNPYAEHLSFASSRTRTRRDHEKYLTLIDSITLLHQYQREVKRIEKNGQVIEYIEATLDDIALANRLAHDILGRSLDELPPPTRQLLQHLHALVAEKQKTEGLRQNEVRFTRREVREAAGLSDTQVRVHLDRLVALEYVLAHHGRNGQRYLYELVFDGEVQKDQPQLMGLIDVEQLKTQTQNSATTDNLAGNNADLAGSLRSANGPLAATSRTTQNTAKPSNGGASRHSERDPTANSTTQDKKHNPQKCGTATLPSLAARSLEV
jgi:DNA primase